MNFHRHISAHLALEHENSISFIFPQKGSSQFFIWAITLHNEHLGYIGEKGRILGKSYGFDIRCYWEHPWGTHSEFGEQLGNMVGTHQQFMKKKTSSRSPLAPKTQLVPL
jgi:hypothetical protein